MKSITHDEQHQAWEREHASPHTLLQNNAAKPSSSVMKFATWLERKADQPLNRLNGLEVCSGKGRSVIWLATQGVTMVGLDFSRTAIQEAKRRAEQEGVAGKIRFIEHDVTKPYPLEAASVDFAYDCFGSTDIESPKGRKTALDNTRRVLKPGGYLMIYLLGTDSEYQEEMVAASPGTEPGSFIHPVSGKYEKAFTEQEIKDFYKDLDLISLESVPKVDVYDGKEYRTHHWYAVFQKPV